MAKLAIRTPGQTEQIVAIPEGGAVLGRDPSTDIVLSDSAVSRMHCRILPSPGGYLLRDLGSRNPTSVNGIPVTGEVRLRSGDLLKAGRTELLFVDDAESSPRAVAEEAPRVDASADSDWSSVPEPAAGDDNPATEALEDMPRSMPGRKAYLALSTEDLTGDFLAAAPADPARSAEAMENIPEPKSHPLGFVPLAGRGGLRAEELSALRRLRRRNDIIAKIILILLFGLPLLALDAFLIWFFFL